MVDGGCLPAGCPLLGLSFNVLTCKSLSWVATQASNKQERAQQYNSTPRRRTKCLQQGTEMSLMKYIYEDIDFVSNYLCSWFFLYLWGREACPLDFGILQLSSFVLISLQASSSLHELSLPPGGHGSQCTLVPLNEGGGQQIDIVLVTHVLAGLNTHFPTALQVTGFFESMVKTTRKYSHFSMYKTDPAAWSSKNWLLKKLALQLCLYQANSHWNQGWKSVHLMCYMKTVLLGLPHKTNHTFCLQLEEWKIKDALWRA